MKANLLIISLLLPILWGFSDSDRKKGEKDGDTKPVKKAVVLYGENTLFNSIEKLSDDRIQAYYDSLLKLPQPPQETLGQIRLFLRIKTLSKLEIAMLMDSLFEAGDNNYALINQINLYIVNQDEKQEVDFVYLNESAKYPADFFYGSWNNTKPHPYPVELWKNDSSNRLLLANKEMGSFHSPVDKIVITSTYGHRWNRAHRGVDLDLQVWDEVKSAFKGKVRFVGYYGGYGRVVVVRHYNGLETLYAHLHRYKVKAGDEVDAGDVIALGGSSGQSTGSHLHFECRFKGVAIDPGQIIDFKNKALIDKQITIQKTKWGYAAIPDGVEYYTVKKGDYLYLIADKFGTTCTEICEKNNIRRNSTLQVGQKLRIM